MIINPNKKQLIVIAVAMGLTMIGFAGLGRGATIAWDTRNIDGDLDVRTTGSLVDAYNVGDTDVSATTLNGVPFNPFPIPDGSGIVTVGNDTIYSEVFIFGGPMTTATDFGSTNSPFADLSANYQSLLSTGAASPSGFPGPVITLQLGGLATGQDYLVQLWLNDSHPVFGGGPFSLDTTTLVDPNASDSDGGRGQYAVGTFTADSFFQAISLDGGIPLLNGYQLRLTGVPEPASAVLLVIGMAVSAAMSRRRSSIRWGSRPL